MHHPIEPIEKLCENLRRRIIIRKKKYVYPKNFRIHGKDLLCQAKAGTGKTAVFVLSVLNQLTSDAKPFSCIVLCHARELAIQITNEFKRLGKYTNFKVKAVYGGIEESVDIHTLKTKRPHILVATPGRLMSLLKARPKVIEAQNVEYFIVDECDRMLDSVKMRYPHIQQPNIIYPHTLSPLNHSV